MVDSSGNSGVYAAPGKTDLHTRPKLVCVGCFGGFGEAVLLFNDELYGAKNSLGSLS